MRILTLAAAALLVVLAGSGIADASVLTLTIQLGTNQISTDGLNGPTSTTYTVSGVVTGNDTTDAPAGEFILHGGIASVMIDQYYTGTGLIRHKQGMPNTSTNYTPSITFPNALFVTTDKGKVVNAARVPTWRGTGGVDNTFAGQGTFDKYAYYDSATRFELGNGTPVVLYTGSIEAIANGTVDILVDQELGMCRVYQINDAGLFTAAPTSVVPAMAQINVGPPAVTNTAPSVDIPGGDVHEEDWSKEPGWNNPLHKVVITAEGTDDGKPIPPGALTYVWTMSKPGGGSKLLAETGKVLTLTIAEIASLGLPGPYNTPPGPDPGVYMWDLSVKAYDGELYSPLDGIKVFVPEPATIGLLSFGIVGALLRRRRRA